MNIRKDVGITVHPRISIQNQIQTTNCNSPFFFDDTDILFVLQVLVRTDNERNYKARIRIITVHESSLALTTNSALASVPYSAFL